MRLWLPQRDRVCEVQRLCRQAVRAGYRVQMHNDSMERVFRVRLMPVSDEAKRRAQQVASVENPTAVEVMVAYRLGEDVVEVAAACLREGLRVAWGDAEPRG